MEVTEIVGTTVRGFQKVKSKSGRSSSYWVRSI